MSGQFQLIDINRYWRTGGANYPVLLENSRHVIIQACAGRVVNELLTEQVEGVLDAGGKVETYGIPDNTDDWADFYLDLPYVMEHPKWIDWEESGGVQAYPSYVTKARNKVNARSPGPAGLYTSYYYATRVGHLGWLYEPDVELWWAEYPYGWEGAYYGKYLHFETFFRDHPWWPGKWAAKLGVVPIMIQFTDKGRAQEYGANPTTLDPKWKVGIKSADLNAGLISYEDYVARRFGPYKVTPPVDPPSDYVLATLADHEERISKLEGSGTTDPPSPLAGHPYKVRDQVDHTVAWEVTSANPIKGTLIIETNAFNKYGDAQLKWRGGQELRLHRPAIQADGGLKYLQLAQEPYSYGELYVKQEDVMKLD